MTGAFAADTVATRIDERRWAVEVSPRWGVLGGAPNGGYLTALVGRAIADAVPAHPDPATITTHYLAPAEPGPAEVWVDVLATGRRFSRVRATLHQGGRARLEVLAAFTDLAMHDGPDLGTGSPPALPPRAECVDPGDIGDAPAPPIRERMDQRLPAHAWSWANAQAGGRAQVGAQLGPEAAAAVRRPGDGPADAVPGVLPAWVRWTGGEQMMPLGLLVLCDALPPAVFTLGGPVGWVPTVELTVQVRRRPAPGWLRVVFTTRHVTGGLLEEDGEVWDAQDRLVAVSRQLSLVARP